MNWFANTLDTIKEITASKPIDCPRGWGEVSFVASVWVVPPMGGVQRACPIGGVDSCKECTYASNPSAFRLSEHLSELGGLLEDGALTAAEYELRRAAVVRLHRDQTGHGLRVAAWVLGPLGLLGAVAGGALAATVHPGFWGLAGAGGILVALSGSFWMLSQPSDVPATDT